MKLHFNWEILRISLWILVVCVPRIYCRDGNIVHLSREGRPSRWFEYVFFFCTAKHYSFFPQRSNAKQKYYYYSITLLLCDIYAAMHAALRC